jgi:dGTPase
MRRGVDGRRQCVEAQVMDLADDIAYSVHDVEDGIYAGHVDLRVLDDPAERHEVALLAAASYAGGDPGALAELFAGVLAEPWWPRGYDGSHGALVALKRMTSELIARFSTAAFAGTREAAAGPLTRYATDLVVPDRVRGECALLKAVAQRYVMGREAALVRQAKERDLVAELVAKLADGAPDTLDRWLDVEWKNAGDDGARLRVVADQVASLTDTSALALHRRLTT